VTTPGGRRPDGAYQLGSGGFGSEITYQTLRSVMGAAPISKFTSAQDLHRAEVRVPTEQAQSTANDAQTAIDELVAEVSGEVGSGETVTFTFAGTEGAALDGNWTDLVSGIVIRGNTAGIASDAGSTARPGVICGTAFTSNAQGVSGVLGSAGQSAQATWILFGMNDTGTAAVALEMETDGCRLYRVSRSGSAWTIEQTWATSGSGFSNGGRFLIQRRKDESVYRVYRNGAPILTYDDAANSHPRTSGHWRCGFREERTPDIFGAFSYDSFRLNSFQLLDYGDAAASVGTGWRLIRASTSNGSTSSWGTTGTAFGATFDVTDRSNGVTVDTLGTGLIQVSKSGFYVVSVGGEFNSGTALSDKWIGVLAGPSGSLTCQARSEVTASGSTSVTGTTGTDFSGTAHSHSAGSLSSSAPGSRSVAGTFVVYLAANDYVQPCGGSFSSSSSVGLRGSADGSKTYFSGAYLGTQ
jgi:hypothetical protein